MEDNQFLTYPSTALRKDSVLNDLSSVDSVALLTRADVEFSLISCLVRCNKWNRVRGRRGRAVGRTATDWPML